MPKKRGKKSRKHRKEYRPLYRAKRKKHPKMPKAVKDYFKCLNSGKSKKVCKAKHLKKK